MLAFTDNKDGYYQFADDAPASWYAQLTPCALQPPHPPTPQDLMADIQAKVEEHFNTVAQARSFDSRVSCMAYAGFVNPFQADALAFGQWVAACWVLIYQAQADIMNGLRTIPTPEQAVLELPTMEWPV